MTPGGYMKMGRYGWLAAMLLLLAACERVEQLKAKRVEDRRVECLDKVCEGDVLPMYEPLKDVALKLNGQWYIGPKEYFSSGINGAAFYWPSKTPSSPGEKDFPERGLASSSRGNLVSIAIFLRSNSLPDVGQSSYRNLLVAEQEGRLVSKDILRPELEAWRVRRKDGELDRVLYVAKYLKGPEGDPPVLGCSVGDHQYDTCSMGFFWQADIFVGLRFHPKHGPDWPEIYTEVIRVLQLLKKA
jgi:hypothetical protein